MGIALPWSACYFFAVALVLALLEIQIEGPHGWAERLPTWRWDSPAVRRWLGKPVTGYHVLLNLFILLLLHLPAVVSGTSVAREAEILSIYFLLCVGWDFLWFACNPHFGLRRFRPEHVWWFRGWWLGVPRSYFGGVALSAAFCILSARAEDRQARALSWGLLIGQFIAFTALTILVTALHRRAKPAGPIV
jgi:hypothetical protein